MKLFLRSVSVVSLLCYPVGVDSFQPTSFRSASSHQKVYTSLSSTLGDSNEEKEKRMQEILGQEAKNPQSMAQSAELLKNMTPQEVDRIIGELERMGPAELEELKKMGMKPDLMRQSMEMMKKNPAMVQTLQKMVENMTPEEMMEQSRLAQERMSQLSPNEFNELVSTAAELTPEQLAAEAENVQKMATSQDPAAIESMFRVAEIMSQPPTGGVTFAAFSTLPPITVLSGTREEDLSREELVECWETGSLGASRVDRKGFERVWNEVQDYFEDDILGEARKTAAKNKLGSKQEAAPAQVVSETPSTPTTVGQSLTPEQIKLMNERARNMSDADMDAMLDQMSNLDPDAQARMKAIGVDPAMMQKATQMMKTNPLMRKAATEMMKNISPEQMMKASQQAQQRLSTMTDEEKRKVMEQMAGKKEN